MTEPDRFDPEFEPGAWSVPSEEDLAVFFLNVGDGDETVIRFPGGNCAVVDAAKGDGKSVAVLLQLGCSRLEFVCASHPHLDHVGGLQDILDSQDWTVSQFWESGFRHTSTTVLRLIESVSARNIPVVRQTSGNEMFVSDVKVTVLAPSVGLRNRYDSYGVDMNNASIVLDFEYPAAAPAEQTGAGRPTGGRKLLICGDAQTDSWARVIEEFPRLEPRSELKGLGAGGGRQPLRCHVVRVAHHGSKHGVNLQLVELFDARLSVISCARDSRHAFPHNVTQELIREALEPTARQLAVHGTATRSPDRELGIVYTCDETTDGTPQGSVGVVVPRKRNRAIQVWRFFDGVSDSIDLTRGKRIRNALREQ